MAEPPMSASRRSLCSHPPHGHAARSAACTDPQPSRRLLLLAPRSTAPTTTALNASCLEKIIRLIQCSCWREQAQVQLADVTSAHNDGHAIKAEEQAWPPSKLISSTLRPSLEQKSERRGLSKVCAAPIASTTHTDVSPLTTEFEVWRQ